MSRPPLADLAAIADPAWLVGGAIRDELLGRPTVDFDVAVAEDAQRLARGLARAGGGHSFKLSEEFGAWRVVAVDGSWRVDLTPLIGGTLESDLSRRDLTINAIARPLAGGGLIDPYGGLHDLAARRLRMVRPEAFADDPLRTLRLARLVAELDFSVDPGTAAAAVARAPALASVSPERVFTELCRIVGGARPIAGLAAMEELGATPAVLPELSALHGVQQNPYHHLDVYDHTVATLERLLELERDPAMIFGELASELEAVLAEPLANELNRAQGLRFGALLHDIAKPATRGVSDAGRVTFIGHDLAGAEAAATIITRLRGSERLATFVAAIARHHLRLGFLVHRLPLDLRTLYRYLSECDPVQVEVTLLSVADRLATRGRGAQRAIALHLELARDVMPAALSWRSAPPRPPLRGDELAAGLGIERGPMLGRLLEALTEAAYVGDVRDAADALVLARSLLADG